MEDRCVLWQSAKRILGRVQKEKAMKKTILNITIISLFAALMISCGWKPEVDAVPITEPWSAMNLPVKENAVVWKSEPKEFRAVHKEDKKTMTKNYTEALKTQGWQLVKFDESGDRYYVEMSKAEEKLNLEFYDFNTTGVVIRK